MKIINSTYISNNHKNTNFKAGRISPTLIKQINTIKSNPQSKDIFVKIASVIGLTGIITWLKNLTLVENTETDKKLDIIDTNWAKKEQELFKNNETRENYLNLLSESDSAESVLWTKGLLSEDTLELKLDNRVINNDATELFLSDNSNETFMTVSANRAISNIINQLNAIETADTETRTEIISSVENKLNALIKEADKLQNQEETSELYTRLSNIVRRFAITNLISCAEKNTIENKPEPIKDETIETKTEAKETTEVKPDKTPVITDAEVAKPEEAVSLVPEDLKPKLTVKGKINLQDHDKSRFKPVVPAIQEGPHEIVITEQNKEFVNSIFLKAFKKTSPIKPETYCAHIDFIKMIYDSYSDEKAQLKKNLLARMSEKDLRPIINKYFDFSNGKIAKIDFLNFLKLEEFKQTNGGEITKKEFDLINSYKDSHFKFYQMQNNSKFSIYFQPGVNADKRLEIIRDFHKIAFNVDNTSLFKGSGVVFSNHGDVIHELSYKLAKDSYEYPNIVRFLNIDTQELPETENFSIDEDNLEETIPVDLRENYEDIKELLGKAKYRNRLLDLHEALNNTDFDGLIEGTHARMRFIERFVFGSDPRLLSKNAYEIKKKTSQKIESLKQSIENAEYIAFINYPAKDKTKTNQKYGPRIFMRNCTIGLNNKAQIHTIWDSKDV